MWKTVLSLICDVLIMVNISIASYEWINDHDDITRWLFHLISALLFTVLSVRYDKD